jgi:hypothetical protein
MMDNEEMKIIVGIKLCEKKSDCPYCVHVGIPVLSVDIMGIIPEKCMIDVDECSLKVCNISMMSHKSSPLRACRHIKVMDLNIIIQLAQKRYRDCLNEKE